MGFILLRDPTPVVAVSKVTSLVQLNNDSFIAVFWDVAFEGCAVICRVFAFRLLSKEGVSIFLIYEFKFALGSV